MEDGSHVEEPRKMILGESEVDKDGDGDKD